MNKVFYIATAKKLLALVAVAYAACALMAFIGKWTVEFSVVSIAFLPMLTAWAVMDLCVKLTEYEPSTAVMMAFFAASYLLYLSTGIVFLAAKKRIVLLTAFALFATVALLTAFWIANNPILPLPRSSRYWG